MQPILLIPARLASTRLPEKPLADIGGKAMIVRVWEQAMAAQAGRVVVATDDARIAETVRAAGGEAVMTQPHHPSGSDRIWEALYALDPTCRHDIVVNVQGDVPTLPPQMIHDVLAPLRDPQADMATLVCELKHEADRDNSAVVKAVVSWDDERRGRALYFTRATAPWGDGPLYHHIGIYAYRRAALERFVHLPPSALEKRERLEQLRALEYGMRIAVVRVEEEPPGIDTPEQLEAIRRQFA